MSAFLHGKLPAHGDFVARGLEPAARDALDAWLTASLAEARDVLGERFEQGFDAAPPWRFAWRGDEGWTAGAIAASVDGVGRRYPILLGRARLREDEVASAAAQAEGLLYDALAEAWDADRLQAAALALALPSGEPQAEAWWTVDAGGSTVRRLAGARPDGLWTAMLTINGDRP